MSAAKAKLFSGYRIKLVPRYAEVDFSADALCEHGIDSARRPVAPGGKRFTVFHPARVLKSARLASSFCFTCSIARYGFSRHHGAHCDKRYRSR
jgi:hypothetical protein